MNNDKNDRRTYLGLTDAQLDFMASINMSLDAAPKNTRAALLARKIFTEDGKMTKLGASVLGMYRDFESGNFSAPTPILGDADLHVLDNLFDITSQKAVRELKLMSIHMKFLRALMRCPGASIFHLESIFGVYVFSDLIGRGLASREADSHQIYPTEAGIQLVKDCIAEARVRRAAAEAKKEKGNG